MEKGKYLFSCKDHYLYFMEDTILFIIYYLYMFAECTRHKNRNDVLAEHGTIASPRVTESRHIRRCRWFITAPSKHRLKLTVLFYNVSGFVPCDKSQIIVFDGKTSDSDVRERFCYTKSNTTVYTRGNHMVVDMLLPKNNYLDFIAVYEAVGHNKGKIHNKFA